MVLKYSQKIPYFQRAPLIDVIVAEWGETGAIGKESNRRLMEIIVEAVLTFPCQETLTESRKDCCAIHSLSAETAISLAKMIADGIDTMDP